MPGKPIKIFQGVKMCVTGEFVPQALGVETSLWHTTAPVKCLRLIISLGYELLPEKVAIYQKVYLMSARRETKSSRPFSGLGSHEEACHRLNLWRNISYCLDKNWYQITHMQIQLKVKLKQWMAVCREGLPWQCRLADWEAFILLKAVVLGTCKSSYVLEMRIFLFFFFKFFPLCSGFL